MFPTTTIDLRKRVRVNRDNGLNQFQWKYPTFISFTKTLGHVNVLLGTFPCASEEPRILSFNLIVNQFSVKIV